MRSENFWLLLSPQENGRCEQGEGHDEAAIHKATPGEVVSGFFGHPARTDDRNYTQKLAAILARQVTARQRQFYGFF